jgi:hypothetical protein
MKIYIIILLCLLISGRFVGMLQYYADDNYTGFFVQFIIIIMAIIGIVLI